MLPLALGIAFLAHPIGWPLLALATLGIVGTALTFTGTTASPMDQSLGTFGPYVDQELAGTEIHSATGAGVISSTHGKVFITAAGVAALTLAAPVAGSPANGGNDGQELKVIDTSGHAHTITTPASGINGVHHIATSGGTAGDAITFTAYNGAWYCNPAGTNFTIS
jgi:hypothetical protein